MRESLAHLGKWPIKAWYLSRLTGVKHELSFLEAMKVQNVEMEMAKLEGKERVERAEESACECVCEEWKCFKLEGSE